MLRTTNALQVILPSNFSANCAESADCLAWDEILVLATYFSPASRSVPILTAVVNNSDHLLPDDPAVTTTVISGVCTGGGGSGVD
jgi:hypothetical protein